jgi:hypothetical protein
LGLAFRWLVRRESFCADEDLPRLDSYLDKLLRRDPGIVGELAVDLVFVVCVHDQEHADTTCSVPASARRRG